MKKDRMIEILKERNRLLEMENEHLLVENERLEDLIQMGRNVEKKGLEEVNQMLSSLQSKKTEYDNLISECVQIKQSYMETMKRIHNMISECKKDIYDAKRIPTINKLKNVLH